MLIKSFRILIFITVISFLSSSCSSVKKAFDPQRKNSSEEFLIEKKLPLSMPPNFQELPKLRDDVLKNQEKDANLESLILSDQKNSDNAIESKDTDLEKSILDKIKSN